MTKKMQEMTWTEFEVEVKEKVVILPLGSTEQHGYQLPLSTDVIISTELASELADRIDGIVAPTVPFGVRSAPNTCPNFPGNMNVSGTTYIAVINDVVEELIKSGANRIFIVNGHYENVAFCDEAVFHISKKYGNVKILIASWWDAISDIARDKAFNEIPFRGWEYEHAALAETSMVMYSNEKLVKMNKAKDEGLSAVSGFSVYPLKDVEITESGILATAKSSSAGKGKILYDSAVDEFENLIRKFFL